MVPANAMAASDLHVLAVDDNVVDRRLIERLLRKSSIKVTAVDSGRRALELLGFDAEGRATANGVKVNLVITDYCMPGMTGYDLLKTIKECQKLKEIPVVVMSSENVPARKTKCLNEGAEEFIIKPVQQSDILRLRSYMARSAGDESKGRCNCLGRLN